MNKSIGGVVAIVVAIVGLAACGSTANDSTEATTDDFNITVPGTSETTDSEAPRTTEKPTTTRAPATTQAPTTTAAPVPPAPTDYSIALVITRQQCFGSAGCNVTVAAELTIVGINASTWDKAVQITYQIDGDESGPIINTLDVTAEGQYRQEETSLSTANGEVVPTATVTLVR